MQDINEIENLKLNIKNYKIINNNYLNIINELKHKN